MDDEDVKPNISGDAQQSSESPPPDSAAVNRSNAEAVQTDVEMDQEQNGHDEDDEDYHEDSSDAGANLKGEDDDGEGELEDDEDESSDDEPLANTVGRRDVDTLGGMFKEKNMLPEEDFGSKSILEIKRMIEAGIIFLSPSYQRESVWTTKASSALIRSIFLNMHVPPLLFNVHTPEPDHPLYATCRPENQVEPSGIEDVPKAVMKGKEKGNSDDPGRVARQLWTCMDGKQRMTAVCRFMDDDVPLVADDGHKYKYSELPSHARKKFDEKRFQYGFFLDLEDSAERAMFFAVQQGKILSKGEILASIASEYADWIHGIKDEFVTSKDNLEGFGTRLFKDDRGSDVVTAFQIVYGILQVRHGNFHDLHHLMPEKRNSIMQEANLPSPADRNEVHRAIARFKRLTTVAPLEGQDTWPETPGEQEKAKAGFVIPHRVWRIKPSQLDLPLESKAKTKGDTIALAPVEMYTLPAVVYHFENLSDGQLLELIEQLRIRIHTKYRKEVKDNAKIYQEVVDWCNDFDPEEDLTGKYNDDGTRTKNHQKTAKSVQAPPKKSTAQIYPSKKTPTPVGSGSPSTTTKKKKLAAVPSASSTIQKPALPAKKSRPPPKPVTSSAAPGPSSNSFLPAPPPPRMSANEAKFAGQSSFSATSSSNGAAKSNLFSLPSSKKRPGEFLVDDRGRAIRPAPSEQPFNPFEQMERAEEDDQRARDTREIIRAHASHGNGGVAGGWAPGRVSSNGSNGYGASNGNGDGYNSGGGGGGRGGYDDDDRYNKRARSNGYDDRPASLNGVGRGEVFGREDGSRVYREGSYNAAPARQPSASGQRYSNPGPSAPPQRSTSGGGFSNYNSQRSRSPDHRDERYRSDNFVSRSQASNVHPDRRDFPTNIRGLASETGAPSNQHDSSNVANAYQSRSAGSSSASTQYLTGRVASAGLPQAPPPQTQDPRVRRG